MTRKALIIGAPGTQGQDGYLPGVLVDVDAFRDFLHAPLGGAWSSQEVTILMNPDAASVTVELSKLGKAEYSVVFFAGHGHHPKANGSTLVQLRPGVEMSVDQLKTGAAKHTLIVDCCRELAKETVLEAKIAKSMQPKHSLNAADCRKYFDQRIATCS